MNQSKFYRLIAIILFLGSCSGANTRKSSFYKDNAPAYEALSGNEFVATKKMSNSFFPLEASTTSYANFKESVENGYYPSNIYTEELLNSFTYNFEKPKDKKNIGLHLETAISPWDSKRKLIQIGISSIKEEREEKLDTPSKNIIFAIDTSGSMQGTGRMELAKNSMKAFIQGLNSRDTVATLQYTNDAKIILPPTSMNAKNRILESISNLRVDGGTNAWTGILLAYKLAKDMKLNKDQTKIVIITDGDFGGVNNDEFMALVEKENRVGINLSILGFSTSSVDLMDTLVARKKGEAYYINSFEDAKKSLSSQSWLIGNSLAKEMSINVKFNTEQVESFRLIGFEKYNRSKTKTNYEAGGDYSYIALYEVFTYPQIKQNELISVRLTYKTEKGQTEEIKETLLDKENSIWNSSDNFRFAAGVAGLSMILNNSKEKGKVDFNMVIHLIQTATTYDPDGTRREFLNLVNRLKHL
ncbi:MAG: von Willebrand factor type A domain-containing protein [Leptospiraceae bacterium]|nr:von Willebrand factor type A domain-containing protein [Leptospiraceae bacterium]